MSKNTRARNIAIPGEIKEEQIELLPEVADSAPTESEEQAPTIKGWKLLDDGWHLIG